MTYPDHLRNDIEAYLKGLRFSAEPGTDGLEEGFGSLAGRGSNEGKNDHPRTNARDGSACA